MTKPVEVAIAWFVAGLLIISAASGFAIANILVSLKYETTAPEECISQITHDNLCWQLQLTKGLCVGSLLIALFITLIAWLRRHK